MDNYLVVITTLLVATQIIRLIQNSISLSGQTKLLKAQLGQIREIGDEDIARKMEIDKMWIKILPIIMEKYEADGD